MCTDNTGGARVTRTARHIIALDIAVSTKTLTRARRTAQAQVDTGNRVKLLQTGAKIKR